MAYIGVRMCVVLTVRQTQLIEKHVGLKFMFPCIASTITTDDQQDATILIYLTSNRLYMFRAMFSPIIRSVSL